MLQFNSVIQSAAPSRRDVMQRLQLIAIQSSAYYRPIVITYFVSAMNLHLRSLKADVGTNDPQQGMNRTL